MSSTDFFDALLWVLLCCIIHQDIEPAKFLYSLLNSLLTESLVANIARDSQALAPLLFNLLLHLLGIFMGIMIDDSNICPLFGKSDSNSMTASAGAHQGVNRGIIPPRSLWRARRCSTLVSTLARKSGGGCTSGGRTA